MLIATNCFQWHWHQSSPIKSYPETAHLSYRHLFQFALLVPFYRWYCKGFPRSPSTSQWLLYTYLFLRLHLHFLSTVGCRNPLASRWRYLGLRRLAAAVARGHAGSRTLSTLIFSKSQCIGWRSRVASSAFPCANQFVDHNRSLSFRLFSLCVGMQCSSRNPAAAAMSCRQAHFRWWGWCRLGHCTLRDYSSCYSSTSWGPSSSTTYSTSFSSSAATDWQTAMFATAAVTATAH